jgi:hypothetical protein
MKLVAGSAEVSIPETAAARLEPGSAVGVSLIRGDMSASAIGTLTYREGNRIVAFGHPMWQGGAVNLPMVGGVIHTILASQEISSKIFSPTVPIGVISQDRVPGIAGTIGARVRMIPVHVVIASGTQGVMTPLADYHYELLDHKLITPDLLEMVVTNALLNREQARFDLTAKTDITIKLQGYPAIHSRRWFTGQQTVREAAAEIAAPLALILDNQFERVQVDSITVDMEVVPGQEILTIYRVVADRERAKPGDNLRLTIFLDAYRGKPRTEEIDVTIPEETPEGALQVLVTTPDSALLFALGEAGEKIAPRSVKQMIKLIERIGPENQLVVQGYSRKRGMVIAGEQYPNLPPSMLALLSRSREIGGSSSTSTSLLFEKRKTLDQIVAGGQVVWINIEP